MLIFNFLSIYYALNLIIVLLMLMLILKLIGGTFSTPASIQQSFIGTLYNVASQASLRALEAPEFFNRLAKTELLCVGCRTCTVRKNAAKTLFILLGPSCGLAKAHLYSANL